MRTRGPSPAVLYAIAVLAVVGLFALSDLSPPEDLGLQNAEGDAELNLVVESCRQCTGGYILNVSDGRGGQADAFCSTATWPSAIEAGAVIKVTISPSADDPSFFIVQKLMVAEPPGGKD